MARKSSVSRRTALKVTGAAAATALVAGCSSDDGEGGDDDDGGNGGDDEFNIDPDTEILFSAETSAWVGLEPEDIADEENPTLVLEEGESYEIGWTEGDDAQHNIEIRDDSDEVVEDLATDEVSDPDDDQILEFEASDEMDIYRCNPHSGMEGDLVIE